MKRNRNVPEVGGTEFIVREFPRWTDFESDGRPSCTRIGSAPPERQVGTAFVPDGIELPHRAETGIRDADGGIDFADRTRGLSTVDA